MNNILEMFERSGKEVFTSKYKRNIFKQDSKPWYTNKCYEYRKKNHRARKTYNLHKNEPNGLQMIQCSKQYKQITNKAYNNYQFRLENELRTTSKTISRNFGKEVGMIRAEIGLKNRQIVNETYSFRCFLIL